MIENTAKRDPFLHVLGSLSDGPSGYIEGMEAQGQRELVASEKLPTEGPWDELEKLGFIPGPVDQNDPLFRSVTLPEGWKREASDHAMWSYITDPRGIRKIAVFYKAAFYDRCAFCRFENVGYSIASHEIYGDGPVTLPTSWGSLDDDERDDAISTAKRYEAHAERHPDIYGERLPRAQRFLELAGAVS